MIQQLCDDLFTFRMELKKIVISIAKQSYGIFSKGNSVHKERVSAAAAKLLKTVNIFGFPTLLRSVATSWCATIHY
jgi:hypothetical protein